MKWVKVRHGEEFEAANNLEIVQKLREGSFNPAGSVRQFMLEYAIRAVQYSNEDIRATDVDSFVADLISFGHIEVADRINNN